MQNNFYDKASPISGGHYSLIRFFLGLYLMVHFWHLIPYGTEIFSMHGVFEALLSPLIGILPNPLLHFDYPVVVTGLLSFGGVMGLMLAVGAWERFAALSSVVILSWLFARNPLIANPSLPVVGWLLLMMSFVPKGVYGAWHARYDAQRWSQWCLPNGLWCAAWVMLSVAYTYSGYTKLLSPSWVDGSAIEIVLNNPLARDHWLRDLLLLLPSVFLKMLTWAVMWVEVLFVVLALFRPTRAAVWLIMFMVQLGFLTFLNFADLTFPMLIIHALTFDPRWLPQPKNLQGDERPILFFDGYCVFCNGLVRMVLAEDQSDQIQVAPLDHPKNVFKPRNGSGESIIFLDAKGQAHDKSDAVIGVLNHMGGIWLLFGYALRLFPKALRDFGYDVIGKIRYRLAGKTQTACQLIPIEYQKKLL